MIFRPYLKFQIHPTGRGHDASVGEDADNSAESCHCHVDACHWRRNAPARGFAQDSMGHYYTCRLTGPLCPQPGPKVPSLSLSLATCGGQPAEWSSGQLIISLYIGFTRIIKWPEKVVQAAILEATFPFSRPSIASHVLNYIYINL